MRVRVFAMEILAIVRRARAYTTRVGSSDGGNLRRKVKGTDTNGDAGTVCTRGALALCIRRAELCAEPCLYGPGPMRRNARTRKMRRHKSTYRNLYRRVATSTVRVCINVRISAHVCRVWRSRLPNIRRAKEVDAVEWLWVVFLDEAAQNVCECEVYVVRCVGNEKWPMY